MRRQWSFNPTGTPSDDAPYQQSRAALRERYGPRAIDASAPGANVTTRGIPEAPGGMTSTPKELGRQSAWDSWFKTSLPTSTPDAASMASIAEQSSLFNPGIPFIPMGDRPKTGADYTASALEGATKWFDKQGLPVPQAAPRHYGDSFSSKFGSGSVSSVGKFRSKLAHEYIPQYELKLHMLGLTDEGDDWPF